MKPKMQNMLANLSLLAILILSLIFLPYLLTGFLLLISIFMMVAIVAMLWFRFKLRRFVRQFENDVRQGQSFSPWEDPSQVQRPTSSSFEADQGPVIHVEAVELHKSEADSDKEEQKPQN